MTQLAFERGDWQTVIDAHPLESHDPAEWLRYGVALLQTLTPGAEAGKQQQQAALAFMQAQKEGAPPEAVEAAQHQSVLLSLQEALAAAGLEAGPGAQHVNALAHKAGRIASRLTQRASGKVAVRTIHHLACTGGTVISKCLAAMPHVALISEVNPLNRFGSKFEPTNPLLLLERGYRKLTLEEIKEDFASRMAQTVKICVNDGMDLVVRDHSHTDFCMGQQPAEITPICDFLADEYQLISVVTVRHPLDSYLALIAQGWHQQFSPSSLEEYCRRYIAFLDRYREVPMRRYEDFCLNPLVFTESICALLDLAYSPEFLNRFGEIKLSGDSGRGSTTDISPRARRPISDEVQAEIDASNSFKELVSRLGYE
jgi:hypothetical protein